MAGVVQGSGKGIGGGGWGKVLMIRGWGGGGITFATLVIVVAGSFGADRYGIHALLRRDVRGLRYFLFLYSLFLLLRGFFIACVFQGILRGSFSLAAWAVGAHLHPMNHRDSGSSEVTDVGSMSADPGAETTSCLAIKA